jgi:hypothetical protein
VVGSTLYAGHGRYVFHDTAADKLIVLEQADSTANLAADYGVAVYPLTTPAAGCSFTLGAAGAGFDQNGGLDTASVTTAATCIWEAVSNASWITVNSGAVGFGAGAVTYTVAANLGATSRSGTLTIAGQPFTVTQGGTATPVLSITKTHSGNFTAGQNGATYIVTVMNSASAAPTGGTVTVTETLPVGLTLISMKGTNWTCSGNACTSGDAIVGGLSYPAITVTVNVASNAPSQVVNKAGVSGGGSSAASATDVTTINGGTAKTTLPRDFRGIGRSDILEYDPVKGQAYTGLSNGDGTYSYVPNLFTPGFDTLRTGDFNGDGKADLILYNSQTALAYIGLGNGDGTFNFQSLFWSPGYDTVETGDLNGDGKTDVALYNSITGTMYTGIGNGDGTFTYKYTLISSGFTFVRLADFNGDGNADLLVFRASDGLAYLGIGDGTGGFAFNPLCISAGYNLADSGDLNGDGKADIILYNATNGNAATGIGNGSGGFTFTPLIFSSGFTSVRLAGYTGDGSADVTVYNMNTSTAYFGTGAGLGTFNFQSLFWSPNYDWVEPEDVTGNGKTDVVLYNSTTGTEYTGISNGNGAFTYTYSLWGPGKILAR